MKDLSNLPPRSKRRPGLISFLGQCRRGKYGSGQKAYDETVHVIHTLSVIVWSFFLWPKRFEPCRRQRAKGPLASSLARCRAKFIWNLDLPEKSGSGNLRGSGTSDARALEAAIAAGILGQILAGVRLPRNRIPAPIRSRW